MNAQAGQLISGFLVSEPTRITKHAFSCGSSARSIGNWVWGVSIGTKRRHNASREKMIAFIITFICTASPPRK